MLDLNTFDCTGCTACYNVCPKNAIQMVNDNEHFKYPEIDKTKCVDCGLCDKVCVPKNGYVKIPFTPKVYGVKNKDLDARKKSQSGGAFFVLAQYVLSKNGVVYGVQLEEDVVVRHARADTQDQVEKFRGSKYVQSDLGDIFKKVKEDLQAQRLVLFSGTPCQVAGLKSFLRREWDNLILVDLICHGVPSPRVWADYVSWQNHRFKKKIITDWKFRDETYPWGVHYETFLVRKKKKKAQIYAQIFYSHNALRKSCYTCPFSNTERLSDITIGDFWGIENVKLDFKDDYGVSAVILNSKTGVSIWEELKDRFDYFETEIKELTPCNPNLQKPSNRPITRERFWEDYERGFNYVVKKYCKPSFWQRVKGKIRRLLSRIKKLCKRSKK